MEPYRSIIMTTSLLYAFFASFAFTQFQLATDQSQFINAHDAMFSTKVHFGLIILALFPLWGPIIISETHKKALKILYVLAIFELGFMIFLLALAITEPRYNDLFHKSIASILALLSIASLIAVLFQLFKNNKPNNDLGYNTDKK
jgi:hypothetical protein